MSGSRPDPAARTFAEQHLGDRLSALVDGELGHETRERVLAHVATCVKCKAEVDAQRRLKNVFAETAPPPPSESFLARLQGLSGGGPDGDGGPLPGGDAFPGRGPGRSGVFDVRRGEQRFEFGYVPAGPFAAAAGPGRPEGFRVHPVGRPDSERAASRGRRFAFVAAGAVSLAAVALGGVTTGAVGDPAAEARGGSGAGSNVAPARTAGTSGTPAGTGGVGPELTRRRQSAGPLSVQRLSGGAPVAPTSLSAPLLPGVPPPAEPSRDRARTLSPPMAVDAAALSPLIRPLAMRPPVSLTEWSTNQGFSPLGLLAAPAPGPTPVPPSSAPRPTSP
ncbi:zf-HC2 domain-containing protein [Streptomyces sp. NPDC047017]|uniref:zf-HC2 domain-containing protein n=1 Tax=Streptomyces sp. NPDC047017 TaxID=3155024 RepID=UPI0033E179A1